MIRSSYLFVPADRPERFAKALASGADVVVIDLEDAVAAPTKEAARRALADFLAGTPARVCVRINDNTSAFFAIDLGLCSLPGVASIMLAKVEGAEALREAAACAPGRPLLPMVETALGLRHAETIAAQPGVERLVFGSIDFQRDLGIDGDGDELLAFRSQLVLASRLAGRAAPVDGVCTAFDDLGQVRQSAMRARRLGFGGMLCIHPKQVPVVNAAFTPSAGEIAWAKRVIAAAVGSDGAATALDGQMIDKPVIDRARAVLAAQRPRP